MTLELVREFWEYHHWANHRLFEVGAALGEEAVGREVGTQFSFPTLRQMIAHIYGADSYWLQTWKGHASAAVPGAAVQTLGELRIRWDALETEQRGFIGAVGEADLGRVVEGTSTEGKTFRRPLGILLLHVPNHATHHRSEIATMLTMLSGSPPDTGLNSYYAQRSAQPGA